MHKAEPLQGRDALAEETVGERCRQNRLQAGMSAEMPAGTPRLIATKTPPR
jgi:hypothetical protein